MCKICSHLVKYSGNTGFAENYKQIAISLSSFQKCSLRHFVSYSNFPQINRKGKTPLIQVALSCKCGGFQIGLAIGYGITGNFFYQRKQRLGHRDKNANDCLIKVKRDLLILNVCIVQSIFFFLWRRRIICCVKYS